MKRILHFTLAFVLIALTSQSQTVTDYDGNVYDTITMGTQVWLKQNIKTTHYNNGVAIPNVSDSADWSNLGTSARCYYNNDSAAYDSVYGALYNFFAASSSNKICPSGWHVSTDGEWTILENYLGGASIAGGKMKEAGFTHWSSPNVGATNLTGFTGLPGGMRGPDNTFSTIHENGLWWNASGAGPGVAWSRYLWYMNAGVDKNAAPKYMGLSVRCVKDNPTPGFGELNEPLKIAVFPNPAQGKITIEFTDYQEVGLRIFDLPGGEVMQMSLSKGNSTIDISALHTGVYILKVIGEKLWYQQKLVKE